MSLAHRIKNFPRPLKNRKVFTAYVLALTILIIPLIVFSFRSQNPEKVKQAEADSIIAEVGKLIDIPSETPTVATVSDIEKLKDQPFFKNAQNGDKVVIFAKAQKAIIYRPSTKKIVEVALYTPNTSVTPPGQVAGAETVASEAPTPTKSFSLEDLLKKQTPTPSQVPSSGPTLTPSASPSVTSVPTPTI